MSAVTAIFQLDIKGILRDDVMLINVGMSVLTIVVITTLGAFQDHLPGWADWFPFMVALTLVSGLGFAFMFGLLMVEESDTGVRNAMLITPVSPNLFIITRTLLATGWMLIWPYITIVIMNSTWQVLHLSALELITVVVMVGLLAPAMALAMPVMSSDKVEAFAIFKGINFIMMIPLALYFFDADAWYRPLFLVSPTAWTIEAFNALIAGESIGYLWAAAAYRLFQQPARMHYCSSAMVTKVLTASVLTVVRSIQVSLLF